MIKDSKITKSNKLINYKKNNLLKYYNDDDNNYSRRYLNNLNKLNASPEPIHKLKLKKVTSKTDIKIDKKINHKNITMSS